MVASGRREQAKRAIFQLLLQQIMVVLEVTKMRFNICLIFFLTKILTYNQYSPPMLPENIRKYNLFSGYKWIQVKHGLEMG